MSASCSCLSPLSELVDERLRLTVNRYFCNPNFKSHIEAIPGTYAAETEKKYAGITTGQYIVQRLAATY